MNPTPEKPISSADAPSPNVASSRRDLTPEERALLPDFEDEARIGTLRAPTVSGSKKLEALASEKNVLWGGAVSGCFGNFVLGFILLAFERAGLQVYGPGAFALVAGLVLLAGLAREWPRRVWLGMAAFGISLVLSYILLYLMLSPALNSFDPSALPDVPPDETGNPTLQISPGSPQSAGENSS